MPLVVLAIHLFVLIVVWRATLVDTKLLRISRDVILLVCDDISKSQIEIRSLSRRRSITVHAHGERWRSWVGQLLLLLQKLKGFKIVHLLMRRRRLLLWLLHLHALKERIWLSLRHRLEGEVVIIPIEEMWEKLEMLGHIYLLGL